MAINLNHERYGAQFNAFVEAPATRELLGLILPSIEMASNQEIAK